MVAIEFDNDTGLTLLRWMNYLFASIQDVEAIKDDPVALDAAELSFRRALDGVEKITQEHTIALFNKLEELRLALIKDGETDASDIDVVEVESASTETSAA